MIFVPFFFSLISLGLVIVGKREENEAFTTLGTVMFLVAIGAGFTSFVAFNALNV